MVIVTLNISVAIASPIVTGVLTSVASMIISLGIVSTGLVVSVIVIFCCTFVLLLFSSVAVQVTVVVPTGKSTGASLVTVTLKMSVASACPISTFVLTSVASFVISSGILVNTGAMVSLTSITWLPVLVLLLGSVAFHVTVVIPTG